MWQTWLMMNIRTANEQRRAGHGRLDAVETFGVADGYDPRRRGYRSW
jgi:hypothetical protein